MTATCVGKFWAVTSFVAALSCALGFYFPYWIRGVFVADGGKTFPLYFGTFRRCSYPFVRDDGSVSVLDECGRYKTFLDIPSLFWQISTVAVGSGTGLALLTSITAVVSLFFRDIVTVKVARVAGLIQLSAGLIIGGGVAIYPKGWNIREVRQACGGQSGPYQLGDCTFFWAFYLTAIGGGLTILCSALTCHAYRQKVDEVQEYEEDIM